MFGLDRLNRLAQQIAAQLDAVRTELSQLPDKARFDALEALIHTMATRADIDAAKAELAQGLADATNRVVATITDLQTQLANGNPVTDQDLADLKADIQAAANIDAATPTPAPTP